MIIQRKILKNIQTDILMIRVFKREKIKKTNIKIKRKKSMIVANITQK